MVWNVRAGWSVRNELVAVTGWPDLLTAFAVTVYLAEGDSAQVLRQLVLAAFMLPVTAAPVPCTVTLLIVPPAAVTVMPLSGRICLLPFTGVMSSRMPAAEGEVVPLPPAAGGAVPPVPPWHPAMSRHAAPARAAAARPPWRRPDVLPSRT
jgi:hypothetical protein